MQDVATVAPLARPEAMVRAAAEYDRFVAAVDDLSPEDWGRPTANELWDVRLMVAHVVGMMEMTATVRETVRQQRAAASAAKRNGTAMIDELTGLQVRKHEHDPVEDLRQRLRVVAPKALAARRRAPRLVRAMPIDSGSLTDPEKWTVGYLLDVILTRDVWLHRSDLARATGVDPVLSAGHDGRIVADVVAEWARRHGQPFTLVLAGPAGGAFTSGTADGDAGEELALDAVEFCRLLSGRGTATGLLTQHVPF
jgi:uncharacterized protein (TIGR03083 family)